MVSPLVAIACQSVEISRATMLQDGSHFSKNIFILKNKIG